MVATRSSPRSSKGASAAPSEPPPERVARAEPALEPRFLPRSPDVGARRRVVVTGLGVVTPIGFDLDAFWKAALAGVSGVRRISHFDPEGLPTQIAAALAEPALIEEVRAAAELDAPEPP